jgi:hypothetical protein
MRPGEQEQSQPLRVNGRSDAPMVRFNVALLPDTRNRHDASMGY